MGRRVAHGACPSWCVADHRREQEGGAVRHRGPTVALGVLLRHPEHGAVPAELLIEVHRSEGDATTWLYLGDGTDQRLEVTLESAGLLAAALTRALAALEKLSPAEG